MRKLTQEEINKLANAPRASAGKIEQLIDGEFKSFWIPKLAGRFTGGADNYKFETRKEAVEEARRCREVFASAKS